MAVAIGTRKPLPRIGALPMFANARECQPVGRPLLNADGRSATGPDPLGLTPPPGWVPDAMEVEGQPPPPEWNCAICLSRLDGPAEEEEETTISFEATVDRDFIEYMESDSSTIYQGFIYAILGIDATDPNDPIRSIRADTEYGGPGKTWVRIELKLDRDGRKVMERIFALARSQEQTDDFFGYPAVVDTTSIIDSNEDRYVVQQLEVCGHQFHRACLKKMFSGYFNRAECPECKQYIVAEEVEYLRSAFTQYETVAPMMQREIDRYDRLVAGPNALLLSDPKYVAGDTRYTELYTRLVEARRFDKSTLDVIMPTIDLARQKQPGQLNANGQRNATWQQIANVVNPQGNGLPPRQQFPLPPNQERNVVEYIKNVLFEEAVAAFESHFPMREDGVYPDTDPPAASVLTNDNTAMNKVITYVQTNFTNANTPLTPGNQAIFLNTWKTLKTKAMTSAEELRRHPITDAKTVTLKLLNNTYLRMLRDRNFDGNTTTTHPSVWDHIVRKAQSEVLGTRFFRYAPHAREMKFLERLDRSESRKYTEAVKTDYATLIVIALRTHPLLDCHTRLLAQTVRFLTARNRRDFGRYYPIATYYMNEAIFAIIKETLEYQSATFQVANGRQLLCETFATKSILYTGLSDTQNNRAEMREVIDAWLNLVRDDMIKLIRSSPWRRRLTEDDFFSLVRSAYMMDSWPVPRVRPGIPEPYAPLWDRLKDALVQRVAEEVAAGWPDA